MWTCINLQHKKLEKIFGYVLEYYGAGGPPFSLLYQLSRKLLSILLTLL